MAYPVRALTLTPYPRRDSFANATCLADNSFPQKVGASEEVFLVVYGPEAEPRSPPLLRTRSGAIFTRCPLGVLVSAGAAA